MSAMQLSAIGMEWIGLSFYFLIGLVCATYYTAEASKIKKPRLAAMLVGFAILALFWPIITIVIEVNRLKKIARVKKEAAMKPARKKRW